MNDAIGNPVNLGDILAHQIPNYKGIFYSVVVASTPKTFGVFCSYKTTGAHGGGLFCLYYNRINHDSVINIIDIVNGDCSNIILLGLVSDHDRHAIKSKSSSVQSNIGESLVNITKREIPFGYSLQFLTVGEYRKYSFLTNFLHGELL